MRITVMPQPLVAELDQILYDAEHPNPSLSIRDREAIVRKLIEKGRAMSLPGYTEWQNLVEYTLWLIGYLLATRECLDASKSPEPTGKPDGEQRPDF